MNRHFQRDFIFAISVRVGCKFGTHLKVVLPWKEKSIWLLRYSSNEKTSVEDNSVIERENTLQSHAK